MGITIDEERLPKRLAGLLRQWKQVLLWGARNLEALTLSANAAPCPPVLGCLPKLRYLELTLYYDSHEWLSHLFNDLSFCYSLESLKITSPEDLDEDKMAGKLPDVLLSNMPNLKRFELVNWFPFAAFSLPADCELCISAVSDECSFEEQWEAMQRHLKVLTLADMGDPDLLSWQDGFECLSRLQYFLFESGSCLTLDLAELQAIPHVELWINGTGSLSLSEGAWQSLEVYGRNGLRIDFSNVDAFVRGTQRFLLMSSGNKAVSQPMCASIREACNRQVKSCYQCEYIWQSTGLEDPYTIRLSNCEEVMCLEPSPDGKITPSGGLRDGYAGTPQNSPLWERLGDKSLVTLRDFWPSWEPHEWVFGE